MRARSGVVTWMAALALAVAAVPAAAWAAADMFLQIDGVKGESTDSKHKDWIEVSSFSFGAAYHGPTASAAGRANVSDLTITKSVDKASPMLMQAAAAGKHYSQMVLAVRKAGGGQAYLTYVLQDVMISSVKTSNGGDRPTESVTLSYAKIETQDAPAPAASAPITRPAPALEGR